MKPKSKWLILAGAAVVAGLFLIFGLNRSTQAQHFTAKVERAIYTTWWMRPEQSMR